MRQVLQSGQVNRTLIACFVMHRRHLNVALHSPGADCTRTQADTPAQTDMHMYR